jgi:tellurite resistance protein
MAKNKPDPKSALADLEAQAESIRKDLQVPKQSDVFRTAVEAGYLASMADGEIDEVERATMVRAIEILSAGVVIEWETETLLAECAERERLEGAAARAEAVGKQLAQLGQAHAGLYFAALVARASNGVDKKEADVLKAVGAAAGLSIDAVRDIVKKAGVLA